MLGELGVEDARFPLKTTSDDEIVLVSGPPRYVAIIAELIEKAECYKAQNGRVNIRVTERVPVVRVLAANGDDYYVDRDGNTDTGAHRELRAGTGGLL